MNKQEAADYLGVSVRTLQRWMTERKIGFTMQRGPRGDEAFFDPAEVAALSESLKAQTVTPAVRASDVVSPAPLQRRREPPADLAGFLEAIIAATGGPRGGRAPDSVADLSAKLWLSKREAARYSGLPLAEVERALAAGKLPGVKTGAGWRLNRAAVERWAAKWKG